MPVHSIEIEVNFIGAPINKAASFDVQKVRGA
jgi:hypothetical protein